MAKARAKPDAIAGGVHSALAHDSAAKHVSGEAVYIDDIASPAGTLEIYIAQSEHAHARLTGLDLDKVRADPRAVCVLAAGDIPGINDAGPVHGGDPVFADGTISFYGQALFAVAAESVEAARAAAGKAKVSYKPLDPILTVDQAMAAKSFVLPDHKMRLGDTSAALKAAPHRLKNRLVVGGQDHFYLEGQVSLAIAMEDGDVFVHCSTQHPSEVQQIVARVLGRPHNAVTVEVRRMGGGFGGKETQAAAYAAVAALVATRTGRPAKVRLDRDDDMIMTGKRHDFRLDYEIGFDEEGRILGYDVDIAGRCGYSADLSGAIVDRALFHADNCYALANATITGHCCKTHTVSNTAFRGFGGPQGMMGIERAIDEIAFALGRDPLDVRIANFYPAGKPKLTPYHMSVEDSVIGDIVSDLEKSSGYRKRRAAIRKENARSPWLKRGLALTPVKFGISFTTTHLNQAGALVHVYTDGSVHLNHGGTEMGQGLFIKVAQVVAEEFQIDLDHVKITATTTGKVPNTSATAASSGSDMNGMAAQTAARTIKQRLIAFAAESHKVKYEDVEFLPGRVRIGNQEVPFPDLVKQAYLARVSLSSTGFYKTPGIHYDRESARGRPFFYFAYGAAVSEVAVDVLTGEYRVTRVDILHDCGKSLNPAVDLGQIEGGFIQGMGWLTTEELVWNDQGRLMTHAPSTYKIPAASDRPADFRMAIWTGGGNHEPTIHRSKAVGEPPLMLAISVFSALTDAVAAAGDYKMFPKLDAPATPEAVLTAIEDVRQRGAS